MQNRAVAPRLVGVEAQLYIQVIEADRFEVVDADDGEAAFDRRKRHRRAKGFGKRSILEDMRLA